MGETKWFDKKHTIFGKVVGETKYNLMNMNKLDVGEADRPLDPPRLIKTHVVINPFDDIVPRNLKKKASEGEIQK